MNLITTKIYFNSETLGFVEQRVVEIPDPDFERPIISTNNPDYDENDPNSLETIDIPDPNVQVSMRLLLKPDTIPVSCTQVTETQRKAMLDGEKAGKTISVNNEGLPILIESKLPTLEELKSEVKEKVSVFASNVRAKVAHNADPYKLAGWSAKSQRAQRVLEGNASKADITILQTECNQRGYLETPEQLATKQVTKDQMLAMEMVVVDAMEDNAIQSINAASDEKELDILLEELEAKEQIQLS